MLADIGTHNMILVLVLVVIAIATMFGLLVLGQNHELKKLEFQAKLDNTDE